MYITMIIIFIQHVQFDQELLKRFPSAYACSCLYNYNFEYYVSW